MSMSDFDLPSTQGHSGNGFGGRENQVYPRFYKGQKQDTFASSQQGVAVVKNVDMVEIFQAGERDTTKEEVNELHKRRWPRHWEAYQQGTAAIADGTPLELLFPAHPEVVAELKAKHIYTIQSLVGVSDSTTGIPFLTEHKKKAAAFLDQVEKGKGFHALEKKLEESELARMAQDDLIKSLSERLAELEKDKPSKTKE